MRGKRYVPFHARTRLLIHGRVIEQCFQRFLRDTIENSDLQIPLKYTSPLTGKSQFFCSKHIARSLSERQKEDSLNFKVTTPLFYTDIVRCAHTAEFFTKALLTVAPEAQTFYVSDAITFIDLFKPQAKQILGCLDKEYYCLRRYTFLDCQRWRFLRWLRNRLRQRRTFALSPVTSARTAQDIRSFPFSPLDEFAMQSADIAVASSYRRAVIKVLASDIVALGQPALIDALYAFVSILLCWAFAFSLRVAGELPSTRTPTGSDSETPCTNLLETASLIFGLCGLHLWRGLKELT